MIALTVSFFVLFYHSSDFDENTEKQCENVLHTKQWDHTKFRFVIGPSWVKEIVVGCYTGLHIYVSLIINNRLLQATNNSIHELKSHITIVVNSNCYRRQQ